MAALDNVNQEQFLYHVAQKENRASIQEHGLTPFSNGHVRAQPAGDKPAVWASDKPRASSKYDDVWKISVEPGKWHRTARDDEYVALHPVPPHRLSLL